MLPQGHVASPYVLFTVSLATTDDVNPSDLSEGPSPLSSLTIKPPSCKNTD